MRGVNEMMKPYLLYLHVLSLVALWGGVIVMLVRK